MSPRLAKIISAFCVSTAHASFFPQVQYSQISAELEVGGQREHFADWSSDAVVGYSGQFFADRSAPLGGVTGVEFYEAHLHPESLEISCSGAVVSSGGTPDQPSRCFCDSETSMTFLITAPAWYRIRLSTTIEDARGVYAASEQIALRQGDQVLFSAAYAQGDVPLNYDTFAFLDSGAYSLAISTTNHAWSLAEGAFSESAVNFGFELRTTPNPHLRHGDMNCDDLVNNFDVDGFVLAVSHPAYYPGAFPNCNLQNADINGDGAVNNFDVDPFVTCLIANGCP